MVVATVFAVLAFPALCGESAASAPAFDARAALAKYWKRAEFECRERDAAPDEVERATQAFREAVRLVVENGVTEIARINPDLMTALLKRAGWWKVRFSCTTPPEVARAHAEVRTRAGRKTVALARPYETGTTPIPPFARGRVDHRASLVIEQELSNARRAVLHEFLHTIEADNLDPEVHNSPRLRYGRPDVVYACSNFAYADDGGGGPSPQRVRLAWDDASRFDDCRVCALARVAKGNVSVSDAAGDVAAAEATCATYREPEPEGAR